MPYQSQYNHIPPTNWPSLTPFYDFFCSISGLGKNFKEKVLRSVPVENAQIVADIGCGTGVFLKIAKQKYPSVQFIGLDPDRPALEIAKKRLARAGLNVELKEAFAESLPLSDRSIDVCFSTLAFHHMPDSSKQKAVEEIHRILKPGGRVVIADFGASESIWMRRILSFFDKWEYLEGNFKGLIPQYLKEVGFRDITTVGKHFPQIKILTAQKNYDRR